MEFYFHNDLKTDGKLRREMSKPYGRIVKGEKLAGEIRRKQEIYAVGDVTVASLLKLGHKPKVAIFDYKTERRRANFAIIRRTYRSPLNVKNYGGTLSKDLWKAVEKAAKSKSYYGIRVRGEEDLASLACIFFAKKGAVVMYGLRNKGVAVITVDQKIRNNVIDILKRMQHLSD